MTLYRVRKPMCVLGIRGCTSNAKKRTTVPDPNAKSRPDLVRRDFTSPVPTYKPVDDITYLRTGEGWLNPSCGRTDNYRDDAVAESFFATLKNEMCCRRSFGRDAARLGKAIPENAQVQAVLCEKHQLR